MADNEQRRQNRPKVGKTRRLTGILILVLVLIAAGVYFLTSQSKLFTPAPVQEEPKSAVKMAVGETPPSKTVAGSNTSSLNAPVVPPDNRTMETVASGPTTPEAKLKEEAEPPSMDEEPAEAVQAPSQNGPAKNETVDEPSLAEEDTGRVEAKAVAEKEASPEPAAYIGSLDELQIVPGEDSVVVTMVTSKPVKQYTWFPVKDPRKLAIDLHGRWKPKVRPLIRIGRGIADKIIIGEHPDRLRVVLWFTDKYTAKSVAPVIRKTRDGLEFTVSN